MTPQDIFNNVSKHLLAQKRTALGIDNECKYLTNNGDQCAIGCLIDSSEYNQEFEGLTLGQLLQLNSISNSLKEKLKPHFKLLCDLQDLHDSIDPSKWAHDLNFIANKYSLIYKR